MTLGDIGIIVICLFACVGFYHVFKAPAERLESYIKRSPKIEKFLGRSSDVVGTIVSFTIIGGIILSLVELIQWILI